MCKLKSVLFKTSFIESCTKSYFKITIFFQKPINVKSDTHSLVYTLFTNKEKLWDILRFKQPLSFWFPNLCNNRYVRTRFLVLANTVWYSFCSTVKTALCLITVRNSLTHGTQHKLLQTRLPSTKTQTCTNNLQIYWYIIFLIRNIKLGNWCLVWLTLHIVQRFLENS